MPLQRVVTYPPAPLPLMIGKVKGENAIITLMNTSDTISSILAVLTFLGIIMALVLGVWSILQTRNIQKTQYRQNIVDNILNWLYSYEECESKYNISNLSEEKQVSKDAVSAKSYFSIIAGHRANDFQILRNKGIILARHFKDKDALLPKTIRKFNSELQILSDISDKYRISFLELPTSPVDFPKVTALLKSYRDKVDKVHKETRKFTDTITKEAIKLKDVNSFL